MSKGNAAIKFPLESIELADRWFNNKNTLNQDFQKNKLEEFKDYFDEVEKNPLNESQRKAVILDEYRNLVIAGAGTGKTSTLVSKVGYILEQGLALPHEILILAFNKDAKEEINRRISKFITKDQEFEIKAHTFHSFGFHIIKEVEGKNPNTSRWSDADKENDYNDFLKNELDTLIQNSPLKSLIMEFLKWELTPYPIDKELDFNSMAEYRNFINEFDLIALNGNRVKSYGELLIANYLFVNGIPFTYEAKYKSKTKYKPKHAYYPDFYLDGTDIYIEYFGTDRLGRTLKCIDATKYNREIELKKICHQNYNTQLIDLYYYNLQEENLLAELKKKLEELGVPHNPLSEEEVLKAFKEQNYTNRLIELFKTFQSIYKSEDLSFPKLKEMTSGDHRSSTLVTIFQRLQSAYERELASEEAIDFIDMLKIGTNYIKEGQFKSRYKYILIDEYQDLFPQNYRLVQTLLKENTEAKLYNVGDDWQCIYGFTGSDVKYTTEFAKHYGSLSKVQLDETFRFNQSLCNLASHLISKNHNQIKKTITARDNNTNSCCTIHRHEFNGQKAISRLISELNEKKDKDDTLLILARNNADLPKGETKAFIRKLWGKDKVSFKSCHKSKGLEADYVIIHKLQGQFPSTRTDDPIIQLIKVPNSSPLEEEERRLLYVALTRAKKEVHITTDAKSTSKFVNELLESHENVELKEYFEKEPKTCAKCEQSQLFQNEYYFGNKSRKYIYSCNHCDYESFPCVDCGKGQAILINEDGEYFYECERQCGFKHPVCEKCETGYLKQFNKNDFISCSGYWEYGCKNPKKIK